MSAWQANAAVGAGVLLAGIALLLAVVGLLSWRRVGHGRLLWVAVAFVGLAAQGGYLAWLAYGRRAALPTELLVLPALGLGVALALYLAVLKR
jgi:hypothetical protein